MMELEREYWKRASQGISLKDYPEVQDVEFPSEIYIAFAVCGRDCGAQTFIVDGGPQICELCGRVMFRTFVRRYVLASDEPAQAQLGT